ncbi:MAG TPA: TatD family hydrolase [Limnochordia bacterium]
MSSPAPSTPVWVDTHAHLAAEAYDGDRDAVLARAREAGVDLIVVIGDNIDSSAKAAALAEADAALYATAGIHPHAAAGVGEEAYERLWQLAQHPRVLAIGEIGLDYHYDFASPAEQKAVCRAQLRIAREFGLPVILHNREADADLMELLDDEAAWEIGCLLHCYWSDAAMAQWAIERGFYFGVGGPITFKGTDELRRVVAGLPPERIVLETDSPYLAPVPHRGRRNEPVHIPLIGRAVAELLGRNPAEVAAMTSENAARFFGFVLP